jgi:hypothetical protein
MSLATSSSTRRLRFVRRRSLSHDAGDRIARSHRDIEQIAETYLAEAQKLSHTGSFGWNVTSGK